MEPLQNCAMTFVTAWRGSRKPSTLSPLLVSGHRSGLAAVSGDSSSWVMLTWWHQAGAGAARVNHHLW